MTSIPRVDRRSSLLLFATNDLILAVVEVSEILETSSQELVHFCPSLGRSREATLKSTRSCRFRVPGAQRAVITMAS